MIKVLILVLMVCCSHAFAEPRLRPGAWATPVIGTPLNNFYWVDSNIYRSEQPDDESFKSLVKLGIKEIVNLREYHSDEDAKENQFAVHRVPMEAGSVTEAQLLVALTEIKSRKAALLIHCWHGSDRTGATVAAYRIVFQNWSKAHLL
jgi:protein tyrosine/serine phosphatase